MRNQESMNPSPGDALIIVDVQNDFLPGGSLAVRDGDQVVPIINRYVSLFTKRGLPVFATRDWHPPGHISFQERGGPWPSHCIAGTEGAAFAPGLHLPEDATIVSKATSPDEEAYSGFQGTDLTGRLLAEGVARLFVSGLATDVCVLDTVRDARAAGFSVVLLRDACRAVDVSPGDGDMALRDMQELGAESTDLTGLERA